MMEKEFYDIVPYPNLLHIRTFLAWDERVVRTHIDDVKRIVAQSYSDNNWGLLSDRSSWELSTPEAEALFTATALTALNDRLTHIAVVTGDSAIKKWQLLNMTSTFNNYETRFFQDAREAEAWLASFGYQKSRTGVGNSRNLNELRT